VGRGPHTRRVSSTEGLGSRKYAEADALREQLVANGVQLYDTPEGVRWRRISSPSFRT
jgi:cysteinyl-tRNA synthetase